MYVGRTNLSLDDVRMYNSGRQRQYRLHENDCRWAQSDVKGVWGVQGRAFAVAL